MTIADAKKGTVTRDLDGQTRIVGLARQSRVVIEGHEVHYCHWAEESNGIVTARCFVKRDGQFVLTPDRKKAQMKTITGRGHIFFPGCCDGKGEWWSGVFLV